MRNTKSTILLAAIFAAGIFTSCDEPEDFDLQGAPPEGNFILFQSDTSTVRLQTEFQPRYTSDNRSRDLIGTQNDPVFGKSTAIFHTQYRMSDQNPSFTGKNLDSVVLYLRYNGSGDFVGNTGDQQTWYVYELAEGLIPGKAYFHDATLALSSLIGSYTGTFDPADSILAIKLDNAFGEKFITADPNAYSSNDAFTAQFKGLAIIPDSNAISTGKGAIITFNANDPKTKLSVFASDTNTYTYDFIINSSNNVRVSTFRHNYTGTPPLHQIVNPTVTYEKAYLHGVGGLRIKVTLPYISNMVKDGTIALHQAQFIFPQSQPVTGVSKEPVVLLMLPRDSAGKNMLLSEVNSIWYNGYWSESEEAYSFIITRYIQNVLDHYLADSTYQFHGLNLFVPADGPVSARNIELATQNALGGNKPKLILIYTKPGQQ
ncbi:MAG: DUF4270 domain-containing protein [Bacteroidota bacterium]|nr:DUF4270 domain-containing protein [Bacteroidota bacterium]